MAWETDAEPDDEQAGAGRGDEGEGDEGGVIFAAQM